jgi:hypothetical protein
VWSRGGSLGEGCLRICLEVWSRGGSLGEGVSGRESRGGSLGEGVSGSGCRGGVSPGRAGLPSAKKRVPSERRGQGKTAEAAGQKREPQTEPGLLLMSGPRSQAHVGRAWNPSIPAVPAPSLTQIETPTPWLSGAIMAPRIHSPVLLPPPARGDPPSRASISLEISPSPHQSALSIGQSHL